MRILKATGNRGFEVLDIPATEEENGLVKLKIETIFPTMSDVAVYEGKLEINYPVAPCRLATAVVSEDRPEYGLKRGAKVLLNPYILNSADEDGYTELGVYGINDDGFLRNFISLPIDNIIPFPEDVKEDEAVFVDVIAIALNALNKLDVQKGDYIAILGGSVLNLVIAQLALYYQAIPILVSSDDRYLELADSHGVYYTINDSRDNVQRRVLDITGGRMADHTIIHALPGVSPNYISLLTAISGNCVMVGLSSTYFPRMDVDLAQIAKKNLTFSGVARGDKEFTSAVNVLAQKLVKFDGVIDKKISFEEAPALFKEMSEEPQRYVCALINV